MVEAERSEGLRLALLCLLSDLLRAVAMVPAGGPRWFVPLYVKEMMVRFLVPAESAARRLLYLRARSINVTVNAVGRAFPAGLAFGTGGGDRAAGFPLFDPRIDYQELRDMRRQTRADGDEKPIPTGRREPRERAYPTDLVSAKCLHQRLSALQHALENFSAQARRMARAMARRKAENKIGRVQSPIRLGLPPGYRDQAEITDKLDIILYDSARMVERANNAPPDTS